MTKIYDLLVDFWELTVSSETMPDYIIEALNWVSFAFMVFMVFLPLIGFIMIARLFRGFGGGRYDD